VVCARPGYDDDELISVSVTGRDSYPNPDLSCPLAIGEHPWITKLSIIFYSKPTTDTPSGLRERIARGTAILQDPLDDPIMTRFRDGAFVSAYSPPWLKAGIRECAWLPKERGA
jgi:hypothetical protein